MEWNRGEHLWRIVSWGLSKILISWDIFFERTDREELGVVLTKQVLIIYLLISSFEFRWQRRGWSCYTLTLNLRNIAIRCRLLSVGICYTEILLQGRFTFGWYLPGIAGDNWSSWKISWKWKCNSTGVHRTAWQVDLMMMMTMCTGPLEHDDSHCCHRTIFAALVQKARRWHTQTEESSALYRWEWWQIVKLWFAKVRREKLKETWKFDL